VGTCWVIAFDHDKLRQTALLEEDEVVFAITPIGYPEKGFVKSGNKIRKPAEEIIRYL
jgi:nitroreductase